MAPSNKLSPVEDEPKRLHTKNGETNGGTNGYHCTCQNGSSADDEIRLLNYFPSGHLMNFVIRHMLDLLDVEALIEFVPDVHITYRQLLHNAVKLAAWLVEHTDQALLLAANEPFFVQLYGDNSIAAVTSIYAGWLAGAALATASPMWTRERFQVYCERVNASAMVVDARIFDTMDADNVNVIKKLSLLQNVIVTNDSGKSGANSVDFGKNTTRFSDIVNGSRSFGDALEVLFQRRISIFDTTKFGDYSDQIAFLAPSSGTTGVPKSIITTHKCCRNRLQIIGQVDAARATPKTPEIDPVPYVLYNTTISSAGFMFAELLWSFTVSKPKHPTGIIIPLTNFDPNICARAIEKYRVQGMWMLVPNMLRVFYDENIKAKYDLSSIKFLSVGGWPLKPNLQRKVAAAQNWNHNELGQGLGTTEVGFLMSSSELTKEEQLRKVGSIGRPSPIYPLEFKIVDLEDEQKVITTPNTRGHLLVRTRPGSKIDGSFAGYYKNLEKTREVFTDDGFYRTGDVVYFDEDNAWWHVERIAELIWVDGDNWCAPAELEESLLIGLEREVADVALVARTKNIPNAKGRCTLNHMVVFVEPRRISVDGVMKTSQWAANLSEKELKEKVCCVFNACMNNKLLHLKPGDVHICCRLPRNNSKIMRSHLRNLLDKPDELNRCLEQIAKMSRADK